MKQTCLDLNNQYDELDKLVSALSAEQWQLTTQFYDWSIYDEIAHLCYTDMNTLLAIKDTKAFTTHANELINWMEGGGCLMSFTYSKMGKPTIENLLKQWRDTRKQLLDTANTVGAKSRFAWYGPPMSTKSLITARIMETWAHGQDIYDRLKMVRDNTDIIRHIAHLGAVTFQWSFLANKQEPPSVSPYIELTGPSGKVWCWGENNQENFVKGTAEDFCLLVTRRRNVSNLALKTQGLTATAWLSIAQCFAGPAEPGPEPGGRLWE